MNQLTNLKSLILIPLALACFGLSPTARATKPDGGLPGDNTAEGDEALFSNTTGSNNTAVGCGALEFNLDGYQNTAIGVQALQKNVGGFNNTAIGPQALFINTIGFDNTAVGFEALLNATGNGNIAIGLEAGFFLTAGDNNIDIGNRGVSGESGTIRIGSAQGIGAGGGQTATFIAGISGVAVTGAPVQVNGAGQLGTPPSAARFKDDIKSMNKASEAILGLKPVTFRYKKEIDPERAPQFGLVAEDVAKVNPDLVARDAKGELYTVRYDAVNAMLLNEFLKEHRKVEQLEKQIEALTAGLQKVNAQLEASKPAPQVARND